MAWSLSRLVAGGGAQAEYRDHLVAIWPLLTTTTGPFSHLPTAQPPTPTPEDAEGEAVAPAGERAAGTWPLRAVRAPPGG